MKKYVGQLVQLDFPSHILGTVYLSDSIEIIEKTGYIKFMDLCEQIAEIRNTNKECVERNLRTMFHLALQREKPKRLFNLDSKTHYSTSELVWRAYYGFKNYIN